MLGILNFVLRTFVSRISILLINIFGVIFSLYCLSGMFGLMHSGLSEEEINSITKTLNGIATVFVALGVLLEERETILHISHTKEKAHDWFLNKVAHENGLGLLVLGLFMEITTIMIEIPNTIFNTHGFELTLFYIALVMLACSIIIQFDLVKDYILTFFKKYEKI